MATGIYESLKNSKDRGQKKFAVLIDPDKLSLANLDRVIGYSTDAGVDYFFIGGSLVVNDMLDSCLEKIRENSPVPMILFPGNSFQLSYKADALLFLSLISGRNPELLIGNHVISAPFLKMSPLEIISTGYMLIDGGVPTTVSYMSNTQPIPAEKSDIAVCTALAGEMLGMRMLFLDAGSGAKMPVTEEMIGAVSQAINLPLITGGGIRTPEKAAANARAGADLIVIGNAIEKDPTLVFEMSNAIHSESAVVKSN